MAAPNPKPHVSTFVPLAQKACAYLTASTDPYHAVAKATQILSDAGFSKFVPSTELRPGAKHFFTVENSTMVAFTVGEKDPPHGNRAFRIIGGHTDSPNFRLKPRSAKTAKFNCRQLGVETYGGGLWWTWLDRDLSVSGKVLVRDGDRIQTKLVQLTDPIARISSLAIHLQTGEERKALKINTEDHTSPIIASDSLSNRDERVDEEIKSEIERQITAMDDPWQKGHESLLLERIARELGIEAQQIADWDLSLYEAQPARLGGMQSEFLYSGRLDNLATVFCATTALAEHDTSADSEISMIVCFDHEEVGSKSLNGAGSPVMLQAMESISRSLGQELTLPVRQRSFIMSVDQAHAVHPNYSSKHESQHGPTLNSGIVIKSNSNQRYASNSLTSFVMRELGRKCNIPIQEFVVRNDCPCGSTIGPHLATAIGVRTVDLGMPQLSMHSCREVMGIADLTHGVNLFKAFFAKFTDLDDRIERD